MKDARDYYTEIGYELHIETVSGKQFYASRPEFDIKDIAKALSQQCRFTGHTRQFYSVAEHCMLVMDIMADQGLGSELEGLMHDASEAYLSDIAAPWKVMLPDYKKLEARIEVPLRAKWGLPETITPGCKTADWLALVVEANALLPSKGDSFTTPPGIKEKAAELVASGRFPIHCYGPWEGEHEFLRAYRRLVGEWS